MENISFKAKQIIIERKRSHHGTRLRINKDDSTVRKNLNKTEVVFPSERILRESFQRKLKKGGNT